MKPEPKPILYTKAGCPWCERAMAFFAEQGIDAEILDVNSDRDARRRMIEISDQDKTPTFEFGDFVVPDFSVEEFVEELDQRPDVKLALGVTLLDEDDY